MSSKHSLTLQNICNCSLSLLAGMGIYLATANHLGISRIFALLLGLALTALTMFLFRANLGKSRQQSACGSLLILPLLAVLLVVAINYGGVIRIWQTLTGTATPFYIYSLITASLLVLSGYKGEQSILRAGPLVVLLIILAVVFDTIFIVPKAQPQLLLHSGIKATADILSGAVQIMLPLTASGLIYVFWYYFCRKGGEPLLQKGDLGRAMLFPMLYLVIAQLRDVLLSGDLIALDSYPILRTLKSVDFGVGISRLEFLGIMALSGGILIAIMLEFIVLLRISERLLPLKKISSLIIYTAVVLLLSTGAYFLFTHQAVYWLIGLAIVLFFAYALISAKKQDISNRPVK